MLSGSDLGAVVAMGSDLDPLLETAIRHSMAVGHMSVEPHKDLIIKNCQRVIYSLQSKF